MDTEADIMRCKRMLGVLLSVITLLTMAVSFTAYARERAQKLVRVGWYDSAFHRRDQFGRRSGYGYEYQQRIATYTGWKYEYVEGSWSTLLEIYSEAGGKDSLFRRSDGRGGISCLYYAQ